MMQSNWTTGKTMNNIVPVFLAEASPFAAASLSLSIVAIAISCISLRLAWLRFSRTSRPFVTPAVVIHATGSMATTFNLELSNSGSHPAIDVQLRTDLENLRTLMKPDGEQVLKDGIERCFSDEFKIPVLPPSITSSAGFGKSGPEGARDGSTWTYGTAVPVEVIYRDLYGRRYAETYTIVIKNLSEFAGHIWKTSRRELGSLKAIQDRQNS